MERTEVKEKEAPAATATPPPSSPGVPWFLQEEVIEVETPSGDEDGRSEVISGSSKSLTTAMATPPIPADLPSTLRLVHQHLTGGGLSGLLHRPAFDDDETAKYPPIEFIDSRSTDDVINWCDWVVFITVRENNGGNINARIAEEVGDILKRAGPPTAEELEQLRGGTLNLDDLLGPSSKMSGSRDPYGPQSKVRVHGERLREAEEKVVAAEAIQAEKEDRTVPAWERHRDALKAKFQESTQGTTDWRPLKILSRETQAGLRIFHRSDPEKWNVQSLSVQFKISPESVRRILKARPDRWGGDSMEDKGYRRTDAATGERLVQTGPERWSRETEEIERLRDRIRNEKLKSGVAAEEEYDDDEHYAEEEEDDEVEEILSQSSTQSPLLNIRSLGKPRHPVRFEGMPLSSTANKNRNKRIAKRAAFGGGSIGDNSANDTSGEWALVDAGWCVVHVMTPKSRQRYRIEDVWRKPASVGGFEDLEIA